MTTLDLLTYAETRGYNVIYNDFPECVSLSAEDDGGVIGLDMCVGGRTERERLAHEIGHCETGSFYRRDIPGLCRGKLENRAGRWAYEHVLPFDDIQAALDDGMRETWQLAEHFDVTEEFMTGALRYYTETKGMEFDVE
jgi:hypothetical protein